MLGELEGSTSEDEEEESFGSMKRRIFAKKVTMTGPERERLAKEKDEALARALRALKTPVSKVELVNVKLEPADVKQLCTGLAANKTIKELTISAAGLDATASGRSAGRLAGWCLVGEPLGEPKSWDRTGVRANAN